MPFEIGERVKAVDENGHWGDGKVIGISDDRIYTVNYSGWTNEFDNEVGDGAIRKRVLPMEQQSRGKSTQ
jgi:hypothetical protein